MKNSEKTKTEHLKKKPLYMKTKNKLTADLLINFSVCVSESSKFSFSENRNNFFTGTFYFIAGILTSCIVTFHDNTGTILNLIGTFYGSAGLLCNYIGTFYGSTGTHYFFPGFLNISRAPPD